MNIGIDIDDTICFSTAPFLAYAMKYNYEKGIEIKNKIDTSVYAVSEMFGWSEEQRAGFLAQYHDEIIKEVTPKPLVRQTLEQLKKDGHVIRLLTARPHVSAITQQVSLGWLERNNIPFDELVMDCQDKGQCCRDKKVAAFLDDAPWNCEAVADQGIKSFIVNEAWNQKMNDSRITRIYSWPHFYRELQQWEEEVNGDRSR